MKKPSHSTMPSSRHIRPTFRAIFRRLGGLSSTINLKKHALSTRKGDVLPGKRTDLFLETSDWGGTERWSSIELFPYLPKHIAQRKQDILINQVCCLKIAPSSGEYGQAEENLPLPQSQTEAEYVDIPLSA